MALRSPIFLFLLLPITLSCQWEAGQTYREYRWVTPADHNEAFLRVGGRYGYTAQPGKLPDSLQAGDQLIFPQAVDLKGATRATLTFEKVLGHEDSKHLTVSVNGHSPIAVPEPPDIPEPQTEYMYHTDVSVPVPLSQLRPGSNNRIALALDTAQRWGWPQNLFYAIILRVYYPDDPAPEIDYAMDEVPTVSYLRIKEPSDDARGVEYILVGREVDWSGRGVRDRKHWQTHRGEAHHIIGSSTAAEGFAVRWDTEWLPDQATFGVQARVLESDGLYRVTTVRDGLTLSPRPYRVSVYGGAAPRNWVTRSGTFEQRIRVGDSITEATAMRLHWVSWSPCYGNDLFLNGHLVWNRGGECYSFATHQPTLSGADMRFLESGENVISTALTPLFRGEMVHGMEVQWPGIQLKVRYGGPENNSGH